MAARDYYSERRLAGGRASSGPDPRRGSMDGDHEREATPKLSASGASGTGPPARKMRTSIPIPIVIKSALCSHRRRCRRRYYSSAAEPREQPRAAPAHTRGADALLAAPHPPEALSCHQGDARARVRAARWEAPSPRGARPRQDRREQDEQGVGLPRPGWLPQGRLNGRPRRRCCGCCRHGYGGSSSGCAGARAGRREVCAPRELIPVCPGWETELRCCCCATADHPPRRC